MKKFCILLAFLTVITAIPSFAMKIIINNPKDRVVYSRSTMYEKDNFVDDYYLRQEQEKLIKASYLRRQDPELYKEQMRYLGFDIRRELAGTKWNYEEKIFKPKAPQQRRRVVDPKAGQYALQSREAADYFYIDKEKDPKRPILSGYGLSF